MGIIVEQVVAHGEHLKSVMKEAERIGKNPWVVNVPERGDIGGMIMNRIKLLERKR